MGNRRIEKFLKTTELTNHMADYGVEIHGSIGFAKTMWGLEDGSRLNTRVRRLPK